MALVRECDGFSLWALDVLMPPLLLLLRHLEDSDIIAQREVNLFSLKDVGLFLNKVVPVYTVIVLCFFFIFILSVA